MWARARFRPAVMRNDDLIGVDALDDFRSTGIGSAERTGDWMHELSSLLTAPPLVEILRVKERTSYQPALARWPAPW